MRTLDFSQKVEVEEGKATMIGSPRQYRADCKAGAFKIGKDQLVGRNLKLEPITAKLTEAQLFSYRFQGWAEILFVDESGLVSSILIKGESLDNFLELYRSVTIDGKTLCELQITAKMAERSNKHGPYFVVQFEATGAGKYSDQIKSFAGDLPVGIFRLDTIPQNTGVSNDNGNGNGGNGNGHQDGGLVPYNGNLQATTTYALRRQ